MRIYFSSCTFTENFFETILMDMLILEVNQESTKNSFQGFGKHALFKRESIPISFWGNNLNLIYPVESQ